MTDIINRYVKYENYLNMKNALNNEYSLLSLPSRLEPIAPKIEKTTQEELKDEELQRKKAYDILTKELEIKPLDAGNIVNNMLISNDPEELINFNSYYRGFRDEFKGQTNITPDVFNVLWNRYKQKISDISIPSRLYGKTPDDKPEEEIKSFMDIDYEPDLSIQENRAKRNKEFEKQLSNIKNLKDEYFKAVKNSIENKTEENDRLEEFYKNELDKAFNKLNNPKKYIDEIKYDLINIIENQLKIKGEKTKEIFEEIKNIKDDNELNDFTTKYKINIAEGIELKYLIFNILYELKIMDEVNKKVEKEKSEESENIKIIREQINLINADIANARKEREDLLKQYNDIYENDKEQLKLAKDNNADENDIRQLETNLNESKNKVDNFDEIERIKEIDEGLGQKLIELETIRNNFNIKDDDKIIKNALIKINDNRKKINELNEELQNEIKKVSIKIMDMSINDIKNVVDIIQNNQGMYLLQSEKIKELQEKIENLNNDNIELSKALTDAEKDRFIKETEEERIILLYKLTDAEKDKFRTETEEEKLKLIKKAKKRIKNRMKKKQKAKLPEIFIKSIEKRQKLEESKEKLLEEIEKQAIPENMAEKLKERRLKEEEAQKKSKDEYIIRLKKREIENKRKDLNEFKNTDKEGYLNYLENLYENNTGGSKDLYNITVKKFRGKKRVNIFRDVLPNLKDIDEKIQFMEAAFLNNKKHKITQNEITYFLYKEGLPFFKLKGGKIKTKKTTKKINKKYINL